MYERFIFMSQLETMKCGNSFNESSDPVERKISLSVELQKSSYTKTKKFHIQIYEHLIYLLSILRLWIKSLLLCMWHWEYVANGLCGTQPNSNGKVTKLT